MFDGFVFAQFIHSFIYIYISSIQFSSFQSLSRVRLFVTPLTAACQASLSITSSQRFLNSCPSGQWCHPTISSSVIPFSSCLQLSQHQGLFKWVSSLHQEAKILEFQLQHHWFPLGWIGWISLQSKGLSRVFSNTTVQKHQFFGAQPSLWSNSQIHTWLLAKP